MKDLNAEYTEVLAEKTAYGEYQQAKAEMQEFVKTKHNIDMLLGAERSQEQEQKKQRSKMTQR